jgi:hypothetical protein
MKNKYPLTEEQVQAEIKKTRLTGYVFAGFELAVGFGIAYWLWPTGIADVPLSSITLGALLRALGAIIVGLIALIFAVYECWSSSSYRG